MSRLFKQGVFLDGQRGTRYKNRICKVTKKTLKETR